MVATYVIWPRGDQVARDVLMLAHPEFLEMIVYYGDLHYLKETLVDRNGTEFPIEPEPSQIAENNLMLIGGDYPNPYVKKYFFDTGLITVDPVKQIMQGLGVYAGGVRCIATISRSNATTVTAIFGKLAIDTLYAMQDYLGGQNLLATAIPIITGVGGVVLGFVLGKKT